MEKNQIVLMFAIPVAYFLFCMLAVWVAVAANG